MKKNIKRLLGIIALLIFCTIGGVTWWGYSTYVRVVDSSAAWDCTRAIILYMEKHNKWPESWEDIESSYHSLNPLMGGIAWAQVKERVVVDFTVSMDELCQMVKHYRETGDYAVPPIALSSEREYYFQTKKPARLLTEYLHDKCKRWGRRGGSEHLLVVKSLR